MYNICGKCFVMPMHVGKNGDCPTTIDIIEHHWEIWDELFTTIANFKTEKAAQQNLEMINNYEK